MVKHTVLSACHISAYHEGFRSEAYKNTFTYGKVLEVILCIMYDTTT